MMHRPLLLFAIAPATLALAAALCPAGIKPMPADPCPFPLADEIYSPSPGATEFFGQAVALIGDQLFVGEPLDDTHGEDAGIVHIFNRIGGAWAPGGSLAPVTPAAGQRFGSSLATDPDQPHVLVVGSPGDDEIANDAGAAYVFQVDIEGNWFEHARLISPETSAGSAMGVSAAIDGDWIFAGAPFDGAFASAAGAAYVFQHGKEDSWNYAQQLLPFEAPSGAIYGASVSIDGEQAMIGAPYAAVMFIPGAVHALELLGGQWVETQRFFSPISRPRDRFGLSIVLRGDAAVIGSPRDGVPPYGLFAVMQRETSGGGGSTWVGGPVTFAPDFQVVDRFGSRLAWHGDRLLVAAVGKDERGAAYLFDFADATATFQCKLSPDDRDQFVFFGSAVAMDDLRIAIGSSDDNDLAEDAGSVSIFGLPNGVLADINGDGVVDGLDLGILLANWSIPAGTPGCGGAPGGCPSDLNGDGVVDGLDLGQLLANWTI